MKRLPLPRLYKTILATLLITAVLGWAAYRILAAGIGGSNPGGNLRQPFANSNGLVAWYPLDGNANDFSGNTNTGTLLNFTLDGTTNGWETGKFGNALLFNGNNDHVQIPNAASLDSTTGLTVSLWADWTKGSYTFASLITKGDTYPSYDYNVVMDGSGRISGDVDGTSTGTTSALSINVWHHVVMTYDGSTNIKIYIDGALKVTQPYTTALTIGTGSLWISYDHRNSSWYGGIDDVRIYNRAISAAEITQLYQGSQPPNCDQTCKVWLKLDDGSGTTASDSTGSGNSGTLVNTVSTDWVTGNYGSAVQLDGISKYISLPNLGLTSGMVEFWINPTSVTGDQRLFSQLSGASSQAGQIALNQSSGESGSLWTWDGSAWQRLTANGSIVAGQWQLISVTYSGSGATAYINGTEQLTVPTAFAFSGPTASLGGEFVGTTGGTFAGAIDDFRIYSRSLAPEEIANQFRLGS